MRYWTHSPRLVVTHVLGGITLALLILHPLTMAIYWFEFHPAVAGVGSAWEFALHRVTGAFSPRMLPMSGTFGALGLLLGAGSGLYALALRKRERQLARLGEELGREVTSLIRSGESERLEFKSSARWDFRKGAGNRDLESVIVRTIAGFLNTDGGTLLIGVADDGTVVGLEKDYHTLRSKNRDGFERFLMDLVARHLGAAVCPLLHVVFQRVADHEVCRVTVEAAPKPVFVQDGDRSHLFVRAGNATRELDARQAVLHVAGR